MEDELKKFRMRWKEDMQKCQEGSHGSNDDNDIITHEVDLGEISNRDEAGIVSLSKRFQTDSNCAVPKCPSQGHLFTIDMKMKKSPGEKLQIQKHFHDDDGDRDQSCISGKSDNGDCVAGNAIGNRIGQNSPGIAERIIESLSGRTVFRGHVNMERKESLVEELIKDLDDINTVPFFDVELPRELALKIFDHLSITDLGRCAQVSKSWHSLSEDDLLWSTLCHNASYELDSKPGDLSNWKAVMRRVVEQDRKVLQNWKERNCGLTEHQPGDSGVLCTVDIHVNVIVAGYSSGSVYLWDLTVDSEPIKLSQPSSVSAHSQPSCATVRGNIVAVGTDGGLVKLFNTYGLSLESEFATPQREPVSHISATLVDHAPYIAASFGHRKYMVVKGGGGAKDSTWESTIFPPNSHTDGSIEEIFAVGMHREHSPCGVIVCHRNRILFRSLVEDSPQHCVQLVSPTNSQSAIFLSGRNALLLGRVDVRESDGHLAWGCGFVGDGDVIKIYDYTRGIIRHTVTSKQRHVVTALNFRDSPSNMVASGNTDCRVVLHDLRVPDSVAMQLVGHDDIITDVQMDSWKVTSGSKDGSTIVWDQRVGTLLWQTNARHPVRKCRFQGNYLLTANIPTINNPELLFTDLEWEPYNTNPRSIPNRYLGLLRAFDFSVDPLYYSKVLPSICSSAYTEPLASKYNLDLILPYDDIDDVDIM